MYSIYYGQMAFCDAVRDKIQFSFFKWIDAIVIALLLYITINLIEMCKLQKINYILVYIRSRAENKKNRKNEERERVRKNWNGMEMDDNKQIRRT